MKMLMKRVKNQKKMKNKIFVKKIFFFKKKLELELKMT